MGLLPIPSPRFTQGASRAGIRRAAALYDALEDARHAHGARNKKVQPREHITAVVGTMQRRRTNNLHRIALAVPVISR